MIRPALILMMFFGTAAAHAVQGDQREIAACVLSVPAFTLVCFDSNEAVVLNEVLRPSGDSVVEKRASALRALSGAGLVTDNEETLADGTNNLVLVPAPLN